MQVYRLRRSGAAGGRGDDTQVQDVTVRPPQDAGRERMGL